MLLSVPTTGGPILKPVATVMPVAMVPVPETLTMFRTGEQPTGRDPKFLTPAGLLFGMGIVGSFGARLHSTTAPGEPALKPEPVTVTPDASAKPVVGVTVRTHPVDPEVTQPDESVDPRPTP